MNWLEVSLTLDGELAEAVADVLAPHAHQGVAIESTAVTANAEDEGGGPIGPLRVRAFLPADDPATLEATKQKIEEGLFYLNMIRPLPAPVYTTVKDADWAELWKANYHPIRVGQRLVIVPAWLYDSFARRADDILLRMDPGMAFGTGTHPTTQLCLALIESHLKAGDTVLDLGCGSGILSIAAAKLGASSVLAVDIDDESIRATIENAQANGVAAFIETRLGSLPAVSAPSMFPLTVANIIAPVIIKLLASDRLNRGSALDKPNRGSALDKPNRGLAQTLTPNGTLIISGILGEQVAAMTEALQQSGLAVVEQQQIGDWVAMAATPIAAKRKTE